MYYWIRFILISLPIFFVLPYLANTSKLPVRLNYLTSGIVVSAQGSFTSNTVSGKYKSYNFSFDYYRTTALSSQKKLEQQRIERERVEQERIKEQQKAEEEKKQAEEKAKQAEIQRIQQTEQAKAQQAIAQQQTQQATTQITPISIPPSGDLKGYAYTRICEVFGCDNWSAFDFIITRESGWNPRAVNASSGACGLGQSLPCSKMAGYGADYATNGTVQVNWTIDYIKNRYGNPNGARVFWNSHNWY